MGEGDAAPPVAPPAPAEGEGDNFKVVPETPLEKAERLNKSILDAEKRLDEKMAKFDTAKAESLMEGSAESATPPEAPKETNKEYTARIRKELAEGKHNAKSG